MLDILDEILYKLCSALNHCSNKIDEIYSKYSGFCLLWLIFSGWLGINYQNVILLSSYFIPIFISLILKILAAIIQILYDFFMWSYSNLDNFKITALGLIITIIAFAVIALLSISMTVNIFNYYNLDNISNHFLFYRGFSFDIIQLFISLFIQFFLCLLYHFVFIRFFSNNWIYSTISTLLTFLIGVAFVFIFGLSPIIAEYLVINWKETTDLTNASIDQIEKATFYIKSFYYYFVYGITSLILCFQVTFKIADKYRLKNLEKKNQDIE